MDCHKIAIHIAIVIFLGGCTSSFSTYITPDKSLPRNIGILQVVNCTKKELRASSPTILQSISADIFGPPFDPDVSTALLGLIKQNLLQNGYSITVIPPGEDTEEPISPLSVGQKWKVDGLLRFKVNYWDASLIENDRILRIGAKCNIIEIKTGETLWSCMTPVSNIRLPHTPDALYYKAYLEKFLDRLFSSLPRR